MFIWGILTSKLIICLACCQFSIFSG